MSVRSDASVPHAGWFVLTGPPGCGKTSLLHGLRDKGYDVVEEAATDVIAAGQARGDDQPWTSSTFIDEIVTLQQRRERRREQMHSGVRLFDRSPICTLALAHYLGFAVSPLLHSEIARILREHVYDHRVFFVEDLGFVQPTAARRISLQDSREFARIHRDTYQRAGFHLVDIPRADICTRVDLIQSHLTAWS